jgi:subfamily B ATP-binding cassette protein MsbA
VRKFAYFYNSFQQAMGASSSIFGFFDTKDDVKERPHAPRSRASRRFVALRMSAFLTRPKKASTRFCTMWIWRCAPAKCWRWWGPAARAKSTLVNLIPRFFDVTSGRILIDGHDIRDLTLASLRRQVAQVTQETILFNDTVRNNIAYGQPDVKAAVVERAAQNALAHDFILRMPQGYDTVIGEKGFRLSGGERQRMAIARAILKDAPILILDEATSALDAESESLVQAALANLMQGRTVLVIAHRLSTIRRANRIAVLEDGRITAIGSHEELLVSSPTYQRLYQLQFRTCPRRKGLDLWKRIRLATATRAFQPVYRSSTKCRFIR